MIINKQPVARSQRPVAINLHGKNKKYYLCKNLANEENLHFLWQQHGLRPDL